MVDPELPDALSPATLAVSAGRPARRQGGSVNPPVILSSTNVSQGVPGAGELLYGRMGTDAWHPFEEALGQLERSVHPALVFGSGMASIAAAFSLIPDGGRLVLPRHAYQVTIGFAQDLASRHGVDVELVDIDDTDAVVAALPGASMLWVESPTNPMLEVADLPVLVEAAHAVGALVGVDNTFATPLVQRPLEHGADIVIHSVTKYLAGHSDVVLGAALTDDAALHGRLHAYRTLNGSIAKARSSIARPCWISPSRNSFVPSSPRARSDVESNASAWRAISTPAEYRRWLTAASARSA